MKKTRIFEILSSFSNKEIKEFSKFIQSGFIRGTRDYSSLYNALIKFYPDFKYKEISLQDLYFDAYPNSKFNNRVIISRLSELNKMAEEFLILKRIRSSHNLKTIALNEELNERKLFSYSELNLNKAISKILSKPIYSDADLFHIDEYYMIKGNILDQQNRHKELLDVLYNNTAIFYSYSLVRMLDMYAAIQNTKFFHNPKLDIQPQRRILGNINIPKIILELKKMNPRQSQILNLYYCVFKLNNKPNKFKSFQALKKIFYKYVFFTPRQARSTIFAHMYHFCISILNTSKSEKIRDEYNRELYDLLKKIIETDSYSLKEDEYLSLYLFREFILTGIIQKRHSEVESFINIFGKKLNPDSRQCMIEYGFGKLLFSKRKIEEALNHFKRISLKTYMIKFDVIYYTMACYYELDKFEEALQMADNTRHFLKSIKDDNEQVKLGLNDFLKAFKKLVKQKMSPERESLLDLTQFVTKSKNINLSSWFNEKINELLKKC